MKETDEKDAQGSGRPDVADLADALELMKADASRFLKDLLRGVSMWGLTAVLALLLSVAWLALAQAIRTFAHPFGAPPLFLEVLYLSYALAGGSALLGVAFFWRYYSLRRRYTRLIEIAGKLR